MLTETQASLLPNKRVGLFSAFRRFSGVFLAIAVVIAFVAVQTALLESVPFWVDEAESSINALTILDNGYPTDSYLGMPIYENTFVWLWPSSPEYEFRDVSYSDNGLAVYHGWLPLYSIAASFAMHGVHPDKEDSRRSTKHSLAEQKRRTRVARLPSVFFAALFLVIAFVGGTVFLGREAGWAALIVGAIHPSVFHLATQARYYAAQVALTTACCVLLWLLIKDGKWRHVWMAAIAFALLFHTHLLSFATAVAMLGIATPIIIYRHRDWFRKLVVFSLLVAAGAVPWILATGFYRHQGRIPRAWSLLQMPLDLMRYPPVNPWYLLPVLLLALVIFFAGRRSRSSVSQTISRLSPVVLFLAGWATVGYAAFILCIPAVSFTKERLNLSYWGPLFLLFAVLTTAAVRAFAPRISQRSSILFSSLLMVLICLGAGHKPPLGRQSNDAGWGIYSAVFNQIDSMDLKPDAKLYAAPNSHLILSFYSGLPIQDITPVRKTYLDNYPGDIAYIDVEVTLPTLSLQTEEVREAAKRDGQRLSWHAAEKTARLLRSRPYREAMVQAVAPDHSSSLEPLEPFAKRLVADHRAEVASQFATFGYELVTRGFEIRDWSDWCAVLKYRFVGPETRRGAHANYVDRLKGADAIILNAPEPVAIYHSRRNPSGVAKQLVFRFVDSPATIARSLDLVGTQSTAVLPDAAQSF